MAPGIPWGSSWGAHISLRAPPQTKSGVLPSHLLGIMVSRVSSRGLCGSWEISRSVSSPPPWTLLFWRVPPLFLTCPPTHFHLSGSFPLFCLHFFGPLGVPSVTGGRFPWSFPLAAGTPPKKWFPLSPHISNFPMSSLQPLWVLQVLFWRHLLFSRPPSIYNLSPSSRSPGALKHSSSFPDTPPFCLGVSSTSLSSTWSPLVCSPFCVFPPVHRSPPPPHSQFPLLHSLPEGEAGSVSLTCNQYC